jgi:ATP-dependent helicase/DNAse subunit B
VSKEIWLGPVLGNNRERVLARCAEYFAKGQADRLLYIAASHPLLDLVTENLLDGNKTRGVWGDFPVYLFRGFVRRVLSGATPDLPDGRASDTSSLQSRGAIDREELPLRRSLISQIIKQLSAAGRLKAMKPLANSDGCVNTVASLIGEIQRAGKTAAEFQKVIELRANDPLSQGLSARSTQLDFDRDVALIYSSYVEALDHFRLTDDDADQLTALQVLCGEIDGQEISLPWLEQIDLLVLDGFFDFTPVQGEMLRHLIPRIPNVIVNLNGDERNQEIFTPFQSTIEQLKSIAEFEIKIGNEGLTVKGALAPLRERLFNVAQADHLRDGDAPAQVNNLCYMECGDREIEIRSIAKEIKSLILREGYKLSEIALVVRERAAYAETIMRVCAEESIPCNLERRVEAVEVPCVRACGKLFQLFRDPMREHVIDPKASDLAHLIKSGYLRVSAEDLQPLSKTYDENYAALLSPADARLKNALGIGRWDPDILENVIAYVGSDLRVKGWLDRAHRLINLLPSPEAARSLLAGDESADGDDAAAIAEPEPPPDDAPKEIRKRPAPIHPAAIAWAILVMDHLQQTIANVPSEGTTEELRRGVMLLLDRLEFSAQVSRPLNQAGLNDVPQATLDVRGLESLRRAFAAAVRSFEYADTVVSEAAISHSEPLPTRGLPTQIQLSAFIEEVERCLRSQVLTIAAGNRDGLRVLEVTDVRGLRFRAVFIAGMIEGGFPLRTARDWLYPHEERERLKNYDLYLEDISTDTLLKEEHYFYQAACRATERLYLTRPLALSDGSEPVASYYIEELRRAISPAELATKQVRGDVDTRDIGEASTIPELAVELVRQTQRQNYRARGENLLTAESAAQLTAAARVHGYLPDEVMRRVGIEIQRAGDSFGAFDGRISDQHLLAMLDKHFGPDHIFSASGLSAYGNCSFRFFAARVLKLEPRNEAALDLTALDAGKLLHDVLRRFMEQHRRDYLPDRDRKELLREITKVADDVFREHERLVPPLNQRIWKIDCEIRKLVLEQVLLYEIRLQEKTRDRGMLPTYFELAFGRASAASDPNSKTDYLRIKRRDETALVQGQIDRVDVSETDRVAIAYDYKLSVGAKLNDIEAGRQVQIPIYLAALEQLFVPGMQLAGGGYYTLRGRPPRLNQGLYRRMFEECTTVTSTKTKLDDEEWQRIRSEVGKRVWQFIDGMRAGDFRVRPSLGKETCKFCDYSAVCRYDPYRISRKRN